MSDRGPSIPLRLVGEFAVIVVGVLVALAVDGVRERAAEKVRLDRALTDIAGEIYGQNYTFGRVTRAGLPDKAASLERIIRFLRDENAQVRDSVLLLEDMVETARNNVLWLETNQYDALIAGGELRLLAEYPDIASTLASAFAGPGVLFPQVEDLQAGWYRAVAQLIPMELSGRYSPVTGYNGDGPIPWEPSMEPGALERFVASVRERRGELLPLAEAEMQATMSNAHVLERVREDFDRALHALQPWMDEDLSEFELGVTPHRPGIAPDFRWERDPDDPRGPEIARSDLGRTYAEGRFTGTADLRRGERSR